jgi:predicted transcriptional regulator of viral defense system
LEALAEVAQRQNGFLVSRQAVEAGIDRHQLQRLVAQRVLERDDRGIYRIAIFPDSDRAELWRAILWSAVQRDDALAVLCDATALSLYDVSTINPTKIDIAIPRKTRLRRDPPSMVRVHPRSYTSSDVTDIDGLPVTTLFRTLLDLITKNGELQFVDEALANPRSRGLLTAKELRSLTTARNLDPDVLAVLRTKA